MKLDFQLKPKSGIGFVVDEKDCQFAVASAANGTTKLIRIPLPAPSETGPATTAPTASELLTQLRPEFGTGRFRLATAVNSRAVFCKRISLPTADPAEVGQMLSLQIDKWSPLPMEDVVWGYEILGVAGATTDVLIVFAKKDSLISRATEFGNEFMPDVIDVDLMVLWRALRAKKLFQGNTSSVLLWIDASARTAKCMLLQGEAPMLIEHLALEDSNAATLTHALTMLLLGAEANHGIQAIEELFLFATDEASTMLGSQVASELSVRVTHVKATDDLAAATGLAQRALGDGEVLINLLPLDFVQRQQKKLFRQQAKRIGYVVVLVYLAVLVLFLGLLAWQRFSIRRIDSQLADRSADYDKARLLQAEVRFLEQKLDDRRSALETLRVVTESMGDQLSLMSFSYKQSQSLELRGVAQNAQDVYTFTDKLQKSGLFAQVKLGAIKTRGSEAGFDVSCTFTGTAAQPPTMPPAPAKGRP